MVTPTEVSVHDLKLSEEEENVQHVSIKAPSFMEDSAQAWFSILTAQFEIANIRSDRTKFFHTLASLPPDVVARLSPDILTSQSYIQLQGAVIHSYEKSKPELFERLISATVMTGRPSVFLQELSTVAGKVNVGDDLVRHKFLLALPPPINSILGAQRELSLRQLGTLADELLPLAHRGQCAVVDVPHDRDSFRSRRADHHSGTQQQYGSHHSSIPIGVRAYRQGQRPRICRAHLYYAEAARSCKQWCHWPNKNPTLRILPNSRASSPAPQPSAGNLN